MINFGFGFAVPVVGLKTRNRKSMEWNDDSQLSAMRDELDV